MAAILIQYIDSEPEKILVRVLPIKVDQPMFGDFDPEYADQHERFKQMEDSYNG